MSEYTSRIKDQGIWGLLEGLGPSIDAALSLTLLDTASLEALERLKLVLAFCGKRLGGIDPALISPAQLDPLATYIENMKAQVDAFAQDRDSGHLKSANVQADDVMTHLAHIPAFSTQEE